MNIEAAKQYQIKGVTAKGLESVKDLYARNMNGFDESSTHLFTI